MTSAGSSPLIVYLHKPSAELSSADDVQEAFRIRYFIKFAINVHEWLQLKA